MSTSLLYHGWGVRGYAHLSTVFCEGTVRFNVEQNPGTFCCSSCSSREVIKAGVIPRRFRSLPIGGKPVFIELPVQRLWCDACSKTRQAKVAFADHRRGYTHGFERYALELSRHTTIKDAAIHLGVGWDMVKEIQKRKQLRRFKKPKLKHLKHLAIDEISIGSGHRYLTVVLDLGSGAVVHVGAGKGADSLHAFWKRLRGSHARIKAVATDISPAHTAAVRDNLPRAVHVFDRFHVVKLFNEKFSLFRQELHREAQGPLQKFAQTLVEHRKGILNYYWCPITIAALEGTNNKIKTLQRQSYGFRDQEFFRLKIFALHETTYALVG